MKTSTVFTVRPGYDTIILCPPAKAGALIALLGECQFVSSEYMPKSDNKYVIRERPIEMSLTDITVYSQSEFDALREKARLAEEAE